MKLSQFQPHTSSRAQQGISEYSTVPERRRSLAALGMTSPMPGITSRMPSMTWGGISCLLLILSSWAQADNIGRYVNIANNIPKMEMKADPQAQAWAKSARNILALTSESIAETLMLTNKTAAQQGAPFFCLPPQITLGSTMLNDLIQQTYREISSQESDKNKMSVSEVALIGVRKKYPCEPSANNNPNAMAHVSANNGPLS